MLPFKWVAALISVCLAVPFAFASTYVPFEDDSYEILLRLESEGIIRSGLITTLPLSRAEFVRLIIEAEDNAQNRSVLLKREIQVLKNRFRDDLISEKYVKGLDQLSFAYSYSDDNPSEITYNRDGDTYEKGSNARLSVISRAEHEWISLSINPEVRYSEHDTDLMMKRAYGVISFSGFDIEIGTDSQWWGPGYHGSILMSNNAEPFAMVRISNSHPVRLPWVFSYLGPFKFALFATELEEERAVPEPYLWGLRLNFKPSPYVEIGLQRTALLGGEGRDEDIDTWWKSLSGKGENQAGVEAGDQRAGGDIKLTFPFQVQPFQLYAEAAGEDEAQGLPSKWAYLTGVYLPRILNFERLDFRAEYANTHVGGSPNVWYNHHVYNSGYTYKGRVIGHHMGTDSEDIFVQASYYLPEIDGRVRIAYDREKHNLSGSSKTTMDEVSLGMKFRIKENVDIEGKYAFGKIDDDNYDRSINLFVVSMDYFFH